MFADTATATEERANSASAPAASDVPRDNNFDSIRAIAATAVLVSHAFPVSYGDNLHEPLYVLTRGQASLGSMAVAVFFAISGFLISRSFLTGGRGRENYYRFIKARALRILPALLITLLILSLLVGPMISDRGIYSYFTDRQILKFIFLNASFLGFNDRLPGVFESNPFSGAVDGSLWTLRHEVRCYALVFVLGVAGMLRPRVLIGLLIIGLYLMMRSDHEKWFFYECFVSGALLYVMKAPLKSEYALCCLSGLALSALFNMPNVGMAFCGAYLVIWLAVNRSVRLPKLGKYGDFSYGIYIFAFPVQQLVQQALGPQGHWWLNILLSLPVTVCLGALSWRFVERPALAMVSHKAAARRRD